MHLMLVFDSLFDLLAQGLVLVLELLSVELFVAVFQSIQKDIIFAGIKNN